MRVDRAGDFGVLAVADRAEDPAVERSERFERTVRERRPARIEGTPPDRQLGPRDREAGAARGRGAPHVTVPLKIGVLLGDDIGLEVVPEAVKVVNAAAPATTGTRLASASTANVTSISSRPSTAMLPVSPDSLR